MSDSINTSGSTPWLSVLIPMYGVERWLPACLHSLTQQSLQGVEVLLLDDASPDACAQIAQTWLHENAGVEGRVLCHAQNAGLSAARNTLLHQARGRYVWFLDSDDILLGDAIGQLHAIVNAQQPDLIVCDFSMLRETTKVKHKLRGELHRRSFCGRSNTLIHDQDEIITGILMSRQLHAWSKIARRSLWQQAPFPAGRCFEDIAAVGPLLCAAGSAWHVAMPWVGYRQREGSILSTMSAAKTADVLHGLYDLHQSLNACMPPLSHAAQYSLDFFTVKTLFSVAKKLGGEPQDQYVFNLAKDYAAQTFSGSIQRILYSRVLRDGWWWRAPQTRARLQKLGWIVP